MLASSRAITISDRGSRNIEAVELPLPDIPGYRVLRSVGRGGMGRVYAAVTDAGHRVAIKVIDLDERGAVLRFDREVRIGWMLDHPDVLRVLDAGVADRVGWIVLPLLEGTTLAKKRRDPEFSFESRLRVLARAAASLAHVHARGVVHCDIKPHNIFLSKGGLAILDFGVASLLSEPRGPSEAIAGTPKYMAPELMRGEAVDVRADVFSFGVMAFELLTGHEPWYDEARTELRSFMDAALDGVVSIPVHLIAPLSRVIARATELDPEVRLGSIEAFSAVLVDLLRRPLSYERLGRGHHPARRPHPARRSSDPRGGA